MADSPERLSAAARTRKLRAAIGKGPRITSSPSSHRAYISTVDQLLVEDAQKVAKAILDRVPGVSVRLHEDWLQVGWPES